MKPIMIANQASGRITDAFKNQCDGVQFVALRTGIPREIPGGARVMIAAPFRLPADESSPPAGWPFDLEWVHLLSVGIDFYPPWLFEGPTVTSARGTSAVSLAEFALAAIFASAKRLPEIWIGSIADWTPSFLDMVTGKTLGIVGFGAVGEALAPRALALGMHVQAVRQSATLFATAGVERAESVEALFATSDHVVLALPATSKTRQLVGDELLAHAKPGLHLINIARGAIIDDEALLRALDSGRVRQATLDVTDPEPLPADHLYYSHPAVRLSPHIAVHTAHTIDMLARHFADNLARYRAHLPLVDAVRLSRGY